MQLLYKQLIAALLDIFRSIIGIVALILYTVNAIIGFIIVWGLVVLRKIFFFRWQTYYFKIERLLLTYWVSCNTLIQQVTIPYVDWKVYYKCPLDVHVLSADKWYLLMANHRSWVDILVLQRIFNQKIPPLKFFMKSQLLWQIPFVGWICWLLGFPVVHQYTNKQLLQNPSLKKNNLKIARNICKIYQQHPTTLVNFVEGTRFSRKKQMKQNSPYQCLLRPRGGGTAVVLSALKNHCHHLIDTTIIYAPNKISLWHFVCGRITEIRVYVQVLPVSEDLIGNYEHDESFRNTIQNWLNGLWAEKDQWMQGKLEQDQWVQWIV